MQERHISTHQLQRITGVATSWLRVASAIGPWLIGFMMFAGVAALASTRMIETRNLRLEDIGR
jgi:putative MFS transporter